MRSLSAAIVLPLVLLGQLSQADTEVIISTEVSCTTESVNLFINPSFETGSISPWNRLTGPISVISDNSDDGQYVAQLTWVAGPNYAVSQTVTGLQSPVDRTSSSQVLYVLRCARHHCRPEIGSICCSNLADSVSDAYSHLDFAHVYYVGEL
ncbi:uncharacterized protein Aud_006747 [Aspergillus udagawae]|uniref:Uncharacterized protein n=1 Tax=Aspergillus udagawae TaxID=91492 RepID=A0A8E0V0A5_9EURO|nr:uncharacterized protein Aud_006747 [Aspergillus udagawae]GIC90313.1 hypothetical protein Aud_006747 [Aspergillus udagawae]